MSGGRTVQAFRSDLAIFEVALSRVLVSSAGFLVRSFASVTSIDPGIEGVGLGSGAGALFFTAVAAFQFPAYRAGRTDPLATLKGSRVGGYQIVGFDKPTRR